MRTLEEMKKITFNSIEYPGDYEGFMDDLLDNRPHDLPYQIAWLVAKKCWEEGHASGYYEVIQKWEEWAPMIMVVFEAGKTATFNLVKND